MVLFACLFCGHCGSEGFQTFLHYNLGLMTLTLFQGYRCVQINLQIVL